ncbi:methyltransferase domain-containing protein [Aspergillus varians]
MANKSDETHPTHLSPSELGTKEYWETFYSRTLTHIGPKHTPAVSTSDNNPSDTKASDQDNEDQDSDQGDEDEDDYNADSDPGTSWFSEHNAPQKVLDFLTREEFPLAPYNTLPGSESYNGTRWGRKKGSKASLSAEAKNAQPSILDLGTGNGSMLALLRKRGGFAGEMVGVDYSGKSVELARELQVTKRHEAYQSDSEYEDEDEDEEEEAGAQDGGEGGDDEWEEIRFEEWDILRSEDDLRTVGKLDWFPYGKGGFDIVLDKGTFDAVSLMAEKSQCERYPSIAGGLTRKGGFLVVTSCNWTEEEVIRWFTSASIGSGSDSDSDSGKLVVWGKVQYPRFRFGGQEGQGVCTVCFQRV